MDKTECTRIPLKLNLYMHLSEEELQKEISDLFERSSDENQEEPPSAIIGYISADLRSEDPSVTKHFVFPVSIRFSKNFDTKDFHLQYCIHSITEEEGLTYPPTKYCEFDAFINENEEESPYITAFVCKDQKTGETKFFLEYEYGYTTKEVNGEITMVSYLRLLNRIKNIMYQVI